jgi:glycolate oxidase FAD binding subunit
VAFECDLSVELTERVRAAHSARTPLRIVGGDTKRFYGRRLDAEPLVVSSHAGIVSYDPAELVVTARAGTRLADLEAVLAASGQRLPFDPPSFGTSATVGGAVAAGLAGPSRPGTGPVRDYVLGTRLLTGDGRALRFGGEVMKNVAGYDLSRLMAGSLGILGVLLEVSLKVLPKPPAERTLVFELDSDAALRKMAEISRSNLPLSASAWHQGRCYVRVEGAGRTLDGVGQRLGGQVLADGDAFWRGVRDHRLPSMADCRSLWRVIVPAQAAPLDLPPPRLIEWHGAQRWYGDVDAADVRRATQAAGGFATWFRGAPTGSEVFDPLPAAVLQLHRAMKKIFDPAGILNPGRMYENL